MTRNERAEAVLPDRIPIDSRLRSARNRGSSTVNSICFDRRNLYVVFGDGPPDYSPYIDKDTLCQKIHDLICTIRWRVVILAGCMNARVGWLSSNEAHPERSFGLDSCDSENGERLLVLCSNHLTVGRPPSVHALHVSDGPQSTISLSVTDGGVVSKIA